MREEIMRLLCFIVLSTLLPTVVLAAPVSSQSGAVGSTVTKSLKASPPAIGAHNEAKANPKSVELNERGSKAALAGDYKTAEGLLRQAIAIDPGNLTAVFNLTGVYLRDKQEQAATVVLEEYLKKVPEDPGLNSRMGDALFATRRAKEAVPYYERTLAKDPTYPGVASRLATIYIMDKRVSDAEKLLLKAVEQDPKNGQLLSNLSSVFLANKKPELAVSTAKRGLQVKATPELYVTLGSAYEALKDIDNSLISFQRAQDLGDTRPELKEKIAALKKLGQVKEG